MRDIIPVTLNLESGDGLDEQLGNVADLAQQLAAAGIDYIGINGDQAGSLSITDAQASSLIGAGLAFSAGGNGADDDITATVAEGVGTGTHLSTSLQDLQKLELLALYKNKMSDENIVKMMGWLRPSVKITLHHKYKWN
jgi:hypothetical protein